MMTEKRTHFEVDPETARGGVRRRTIVKGAAWSIPVIALSAAAPAHAASTGKALSFRPASSCIGQGSQGTLFLALANPGPGDSATLSLTGTGYTFADGSTTAVVSLVSGSATITVKNVSGSANAVVHAVLASDSTVTADTVITPTCGGHPATVLSGVGNTDVDGADGKVYVTHATTSGGYVTVLDATTGATLTTWRTPAAAYNVVVSPDGKTVYASWNSGITFFDAATGTVLREVTLPQRAIQGLAISADGTRLTSFGSGGAAVIDTTTGQVVQNIAATFPVEGTASPDGATLYRPTSQLYGVKVEVIDAATGTVTRTVSATGPMFPAVGDTYAIEVSSDGKTMYVAPHGVGTPPLNLVAVDIATGSVTGVYPLPNSSFVAGIGLSPDGTRAWAVSYPNGPTLTVDL